MIGQTIEVDVEVECPDWTKALPDAVSLSEAAATAAIRALTPSAIATRERGEPQIVVGGGPDIVFHMTTVRIAVALTDDETVARFNQQFRGKPGPTNVLSFEAGFNMEGLLGDIALAFGVCAREAAEQGKPLAHHLQHLVAHGVLHLVGYDHQTEAEAGEMEALERRILAGLGVPDPYA